MNWPTSQDYNEAVQDAANYSDPALKRGEVVTNALGLPVPRSGNFADVYQFKDGDGKMWALKCFTRKVAGLRERYVKIDEHLGKAKLPFAVGFKFMEQGIQVKGEWFPLLKMEWVEGFTLNDFVSENINKPHYLHALMQMWAKLAGRLRDANMAHADLQHGNVLLVPGATPQKLGLKLIDYDGMWVPALSDYHSGEVGHPNYQHPMRLKDKLYNGDVDRFPHLVVAAGLRATVVGGKAIWDRFDNGDNLLFKESDLRDPANAKVFKSLWELNDPVLRTLVGHIALSAKEPMRKTPWLDDILFEESGPKLTGDQEKRVCEMLGVSSAAPAVKSAAQAKVEQEFNVFEFLDDDEPAPSKTERSSGRNAPATRIRKPRRKQKSNAPLLIGGALAACLVVGGVVLAFAMSGGKKDPPTEVAEKEKERPKLPPGGAVTKSTVGGVVEPAPKEVKKAEPLELRIVVVIDGKDELRLTKHTAQWVHHSWQWPPQVKLNSIDWNPQATPMMSNMGTTRLVSEELDDLSTAKLTKVHGRGPATLTAKMDSLAILFDDDGHLGADTYEVVLSFDKAPVPPAGGSNTAAIAVAALSNGRDYLFIRDKDPALYMTVNGSARKAREVGRHGSPIRSLATASDGARAVTGSEDGEIRIWNLSSSPSPKEVENSKPIAKPPEAKKPLATKVSGPTKFDGFKRNYEFTLYREGILIRDVDANKEETLHAGAPVAEKDGKFEGSFAFARLNTAYGPPVTVPTKLFGGDIEIVLCKRGFFVNQVGTNKNWNISGGREVFDEPGPAKAETPKVEPKRADFVWLDDALPTGAMASMPAGPDLPWVFTSKSDGPVASGDKAVKLSASGINQNVLEKATPGMLVGEGDVLFAYVYLDPKNPPEEIMIQWQVADWHRPYWGVNKIGWGRDNSWERKPMGALPETGKWVRLEIKISDIGIEPGKYIKGLALVQFGGTAYWDRIGINTQTPQEDGLIAPKSESAVALKEHTAAVVACAISVDGTRAVSVGKDKNLCEWNLAEGKLVRKFNVPDPQAVAFLPDGKTVLLGTASESAGIWDLEKQTRIKHLEGHTTPVLAVAVSPKGDLAFTGGDELLVKVWILPEGRLSGGIPFEPQGVSALAVSPDGLILACAGPGSTLRFFDPRTGRPQGGNPTKSRSFALTFLSNTELIAARNPDPVRVRAQRDDMPAESATYKLLHETDPLNEGGGRIGFSRDGKHLFHLQKSTITVLETETGKTLNQIPFEGQLFDIALGAEKQLYIAMNDGKFQLWDWGTGKMVKQVDFREMKQPAVMNINLTDDPDRLFVLTGSPFGFVWDVSEWKSSKRVQPYVNEASLRGHMYPSGSQVLIQIGNATGGRLAVWDIAKSQHAFDLERVDAKVLSNISVSPNGKWIVATTNDDAGKAFVWDAKTGKISKTLTSVQARGLRGGFTAGGDHFIFQEGASRRVVVDLEKDQVVDEMRPRVPANGMVVNSTASVMATVDADRRLRIWRIEIDSKPTPVVGKTPTPKEIAKEKVGFIVESEALSGSALLSTFSGDGKKIYVVTQSGTVHVLDAVTLKEKSKFEASKTRITHVAAVQKTSTGAQAEKLYLLDDERHVSAWDPEKGTRVKLWNMSKPMEKLKTVHHFIASTTDSFLMIFDNDAGTSIAFDTVAGTLRVPPGLSRPPFNSSTNLVAFTPDAKIGTANASRKILVWTVSTGNPIRVIEANFGARWMGLVPEASTVTAASGNQLVGWNYTTGTKTFEITDPHGIAGDFHLAASLKGNYVLSAGRDQTLRVWDVTTGKEATQWKLEWPSDGIAISHDGKFAAVWHNSANKVSLWAIPKPKAGN